MPMEMRPGSMRGVLGGRQLLASLGGMLAFGGVGCAGLAVTAAMGISPLAAIETPL